MYLRKHERVIIRRVKWPLGPFCTEGNLECLPTSQVLPPCFPTPFFSLIEHISRSGKNARYKKQRQQQMGLFLLSQKSPGDSFRKPGLYLFWHWGRMGFFFAGSRLNPMDNEPFDDKRSSFSPVKVPKVPKVYRRNSEAKALCAAAWLPLQMAPRHHSMGQKLAGEDEASKQANRFFCGGCCSGGLTASAS